MTNPAKRTYNKREIWHLGGRKKQKAGFLPIFGLLAKPLLTSAVRAVKGLEGKIYERGKRRLKGRSIRRLSYA